MNQGHLLATDTPRALIAAKAATGLEDAFIAFIRDDRARSGATVH